MKKLFIDLKKEIYQLWENNLELSNFTKLPKDLIYNEVQPNYIFPAKKLENWQSHSLETMKIHNIIKQLSPYVNWKQTYEEKDVGKDFLEKYGYFELFGPTGHFLTNKMSLFVFFVGCHKSKSPGHLNARLSLKSIFINNYNILSLLIYLVIIEL